VKGKDRVLWYNAIQTTKDVTNRQSKLLSKSLVAELETVLSSTF
jgi:hypothetical protein